MARPDAVYRIKRPSVVSETIDGEVLVLRLTPGYYYSLDGTVVPIWEGIEQGQPLRAIQARLVALYDGDGEEIRRSVAGFVDDLAGEELIEEARESPIREAAVAAGSANGAPRAQFQAPVLHRYTDMQDLLVLDPIHDVGETGWPTPKDA